MADKPTLEQVMKLEDQLEMIIEADSAIHLPAETSERLRKLKLALANSDLGGPRRALRIDATNEFFDNTLAQNMTIAQGFIEQFPVTPLELETFRETGEVADYQRKRAYRKEELKHFDIEVLEDAWKRIYKSDPRKRFNPPRKDRLIETKDPLAMAEYRKALTQALERTPRVGDEIYRFEGNKKMKQYLSAIDTVYVPIDQTNLKAMLRRVDRLPKDIAYDTVRTMMDMAMGSKSDIVWGIPKNLAWEVASKLEDDETNRLLRRAIARGATNLTETDIENSIFNRQFTEDLKGIIRQIKDTPEATKMARTNSGRGEVVDLNTDKYYAIDPGTADLYAARTQEAMEARAKSRNPKAIAKINKLIQDVVDMGYSDVDTAVIVNQSVLDYLENVEGSIDEDVRRFMSYSNMMPPEMVDRLNQLGPQRTRQLVEGARRLGLRIPTSLGALGLIALLPLLDDEEAVAGGTGLAAAGTIGPPTELQSLVKEKNYLDRVGKRNRTPEQTARLTELRSQIKGIKAATTRLLSEDDRWDLIKERNYLQSLDNRTPKQTARLSEINTEVRPYIDRARAEVDAMTPEQRLQLQLDMEANFPTYSKDLPEDPLIAQLMPTSEELADLPGVSLLDDPPLIPPFGIPPDDTVRQTAADNLIDATDRFRPPPEVVDLDVVEGADNIYDNLRIVPDPIEVTDDMFLTDKTPKWAEREAAEEAAQSMAKMKGSLAKRVGSKLATGAFGAIDALDIVDAVADPASREGFDALGSFITGGPMRSDNPLNAEEIEAIEGVLGHKPRPMTTEEDAGEGETYAESQWLGGAERKGKIVTSGSDTVQERISPDRLHKYLDYLKGTYRWDSKKKDYVPRVASNKGGSPFERKVWSNIERSLRGPEAVIEMGPEEEMTFEWSPEETKEALEKMGIGWEEVMN